jgi:predicted ATP-dependent endonuclease of OLD family
LSLNDSIVTHIPLMIDRILRKQKAIGRQVIITTHSEALLKNQIDGNSIILLETGADGTTARVADEIEISLMSAGLTPAEIMLPKARPNDIEQLGLL